LKISYQSENKSHEILLTNSAVLMCIRFCFLTTAEPE